MSILIPTRRPLWTPARRPPFWCPVHRRPTRWAPRVRPPLMNMATGDRLLDTSGNVILDASGNVQLSDGAGDGCCCGGPSTNCLLCSGTVHDNITLIASSVSVSTTCTAQGVFGPSVQAGSASFSGTFTLTRTADLSNCIWEYIESPGTTITGTSYTGTLCTISPVSLDLLVRVTRSASSPHVQIFIGMSKGGGLNGFFRLFEGSQDQDSACINVVNIPNIYTSYNSVGAGVSLGINGTVDVME